MYAKLNDLRSHLDNKHTAHNFHFLHLHRRVPVKNSAVAHENVRLSIGMYGLVSDLVPSSSVLAVSRGSLT